MKLKKLLLILVLGLATHALATNYAGWYARDIVISSTAAGISTPQTSFPLLVRLNAANFTFTQSKSDIATIPVAMAYTRPGGSDVRFTAADGTTDLPYQIERWDGVKKVAEIWVLVPSVSGSGNTTVKMFWGGNGTAAAELPAMHNGSTVFDPANGFETVHHFVTQIDAAVSEPSSTLLDLSNFVMQKASGTNIFGVVADSADIGYGTTLDGVTNAYSINSSKNNTATDYQPNSHYTLSTWVKNAGTAAAQSRVLSKSGEFYLGTNANGSQWEMAEYEDSAGTQTVDVPMTSGWTHITGVRNGTAMTLYVNGTVSSGVIHTDSTHFKRPTSSSVAPNVIQTVGIGREVGSTSAAPAQGLYFKGSLDEIRMENVSRSADWVALSYATQKLAVTAVTYGTVTAPTTAIHAPVTPALNAVEKAPASFVDLRGRTYDVKNRSAASRDKEILENKAFQKHDRSKQNTENP